MTPEAGYKFLACLNVYVGEVHNGWLTAKCPLAPFTHANGTDSRPSFGINLESGKFNCFTCQSGHLAKLLQLAEMHLASRPELEPLFRTGEARKILDGLEGEDVLPPFGADPAGPEFEAWPDWWLAQYLRWRDSPRAAWYLGIGRSETNGSEPVDPEIADKMDLRYDPAHDRVVCPYLNAFGKLAGARGRSIEKGAHPGHFDYECNKVRNTRLVWYNEQCLGAAVNARMPVVVVEGQFDAMNVMRVYPYVLANMTAKSSLEKMQKLQQCSAVLVMPDHDPAGLASVERYKKYLPGVPLGMVDYPADVKDPAKLSREQLVVALEGLTLI